MKSPLLAVAAVAVLSLGGCGDGRSTTEPEGGDAVFSNPVHSGDTPDPQAVLADGTWYLFHTNAAGSNVPVLTSPDLVTWRPAGDAMPVLPAWADPGKTWAPEAIALGPQRYVLYPTVADRASGRQCIARATATRPGGPYTDTAAAPLVCQADLGGSIDASPFRDSDGSLYLLWKNDGNAVGQDTWLWSQRLSEDGLRLVGEPVRLLRQTEPWEGHVVEGPFLWRHEDRLYLFYAANAYDKADYAEGYALCDTPLGPCRKPGGDPVLKSGGGASGPGHASMVEFKGRTWLLYHAWPPGAEGSVSPGRQLWLDEVTWEDGRPVVHGPTRGPQQRP
ncbi:glycoside hydrolase family 43 protein [Dactylosporangium sp. NPDC000521]|uniref:glycoside hydrolase family 43 protein n=1 Tax=Dactylosporangium sp. NPDC000521 TaxID=3363975 RepID=UPI0036D07BC9